LSVSALADILYKTEMSLPITGCISVSEQQKLAMNGVECNSGNRPLSHFLGRRLHPH